jgi:lipopolysaccharide biosynthesis glycosyltransferase
MKLGFVTCADTTFMPGLEKLDKTILKHNNMTGIDKILISPNINEFMDYRIIRPDSKLINVPITNRRFKTAYYKLMLFSFSSYDRVVYIDSDVLCLGDISKLFDNDSELCATKDDGINLNIMYYSHFRINSGVLSVGKKLLGIDVYDKMVQIAMSGRSYDGGDQGVINEYIHQYNIPVTYLPMQYNTLKRIYFHHPEIWNKIKDDIRLLHFVGKDKPWCPGDSRYNELYKWWEQA